MEDEASDDRCLFVRPDNKFMVFFMLPYGPERQKVSTYGTGQVLVPICTIVNIWKGCCHLLSTFDGVPGTGPKMQPHNLFDSVKSCIVFVFWKIHLYVCDRIDRTVSILSKIVLNQPALFYTGTVEEGNSGFGG